MVSVGAMEMAKKKPGRPKTSTRDDVTVKLDRAVAEECRAVAALNRLTLAEYLTELVRPLVRRDFGKAAKLRSGGPEEPKPKGAK